MKAGNHGQMAFNHPKFDVVDRKILTELGRDGRIPLAKLGRRVNLSSPAVAQRVQRLEREGVITGYRAVLNPRALGYALTAIVRIQPAPGQLTRVPELALQIPEVAECHRITGEDCYYVKIHLRTIEDLSSTLDRFLVFGQTITSIVNSTPLEHRDPPAVYAE